MVREFVDGWDVIQTLGEGAYGEVVLIVNRESGQPVATKSVDVDGGGEEMTKNVKKEICVHRLVSHENVIRYFGYREEGTVYFIFMEYASGGELFDRIEPEHGMPQVQAHKYFTQIIAGVEYLHSVGIAHRDLKPENVLLDEHDNVKITDFGLATIFRHQGKERMLNKRCGTLPYVAPEVFTRVYRAEPADTWSCGIILVAMLAGELPWDKPMSECKEYEFWRESKPLLSPWTRIDSVALALLKKTLFHSPAKRYTIADIKKHMWFTKLHIFKGMTRWDGNNIPYKRHCSYLDPSLGFEKDEGITKVSCSQPDPFVRQENDVVDIHTDSLHVLTHGISFSQPARPENMILCSQTPATPGTSQATLNKLTVRRMTRFSVKMSPEATVEELKMTLDKLGYSWKKSEPGHVTVSCLDRRKMQLVFKAILMEMQDNIVLDFRLSRGDGLEFKRHFLIIRNSMSHIIAKGPIIWPLKMAKRYDPVELCGVTK